MIVETAGRGDRDNYKLLIGSVVPRPVAWVSTADAEGRLNLAPFSFFGAVCSDPPTVVVSVGRRDNGDWKDTAVNALALQEFVVNIVNMEMAEAMNTTSGDYPSGMSEFGVAGLTPAPSARIKPPRVAEAPIALECKLVHAMDLGAGNGQNKLLFGQVVAFYVRDDLYFDGKIDAQKLRPLGRLAGNQYLAPGEIFEMVRPIYQGDEG